jgi:hypothetical protein
VKMMLRTFKKSRMPFSWSGYLSRARVKVFKMITEKMKASKY